MDRKSDILSLRDHLNREISYIRIEALGQATLLRSALHARAQLGWTASFVATSGCPSMSKRHIF